MSKTHQRTQALSLFVEWCSKHITGDEKGEAQIFLDHLFKAFGYPDGLREAGATLEMRVKKEDRGTNFADLVWKPIVLVEMKKRGQDLSRHYRQAFDYWMRLTPNRPRFVILCNFDEFWVYDFDTQYDSPVDKVSLKDLPERFGPLAFFFPEGDAPVFGNHQESVTRAAADQLVILFKSLINRKIDRDIAQRFALQTLLVLFAEDIGLLEKYFFSSLLNDCKKPADTYDLIGGLFVEMNTPGKTPGGRYSGVDYFNGGLFSNPTRLELTLDEVEMLKEAARYDWSKVRPEIFGAIFEHSMGEADRHAYGAHFTSPVDIMKIIGPTIVEPWTVRIEASSTVKRLNHLLTRLACFKVLDPTCGSGNFLYIAYREIKRLEARIYERLITISKTKKAAATQRELAFVTARNFYGMDINPFAVELAKVTMMLAHKLAIDELHVTENALPLDNLDDNFISGDALIQPDGSRTVWPKADVIIGNPPYLGAKKLKPERGVKYVNSLRKLYPEVPGMADYCVYWFRRAHDELSECTVQDPFAGRAGLVGTQNIRSNASREGGLDYICSTGEVIEAVDNQPWSGEAVVHVSIVNWIKSQDENLVPEKKFLWSRTAKVVPAKRHLKGTGSAAKEFELECHEVRHINSALSNQVDVALAAVLLCNKKAGLVCQGVTPGHAGFVISSTERVSIISKSPTSAKVIHPYIVGDDVLSGAARADRYIIDLNQQDILKAQVYKGAFEHLKTHVLPAMLKASTSESERATSLECWWKHWRPRREMIQNIKSHTRYLACSRVTKRPIFVFIDSTVCPGDALQVFAFSDDYSFGILQSVAHLHWFDAKCSNMKSDPRYTSTSVFDTFPWPQNPSAVQVNAIAEAGRELRKLRDTSLTTMTGGLRALYRTLDLPGKNPLREAHAALDAAVLKAYEFSAKRDLLEQILGLNQSVAAKITAGCTVTAPGIPTTYKKSAYLLSKDCIG